MHTHTISVVTYRSGRTVHQKVIIDAISSHLDLAEGFVNWALLFAAAIAWTGLQKKREIEAFHVTVDRRNAFVAVAVLYLFATMALAVIFLRIGDLVALLDGAHFSEGVSTLGTHRWLLNPFSYFGQSAIARGHSGEGYGLLIVVWWLCNSSLYTLMDDKRSRRAKTLLAFFLGVGLLAMVSIQRVYQLLVVRAELFDKPFHDAIVATGMERFLAAFLGIAAGGLLFVATNYLQMRSVLRSSSSEPVGLQGTSGGA